MFATNAAHWSTPYNDRDNVSDSLVNTGESVDEDKAGDHSVMLIELE